MEIILKVGENEFAPLLDRGKAVADVNRAFSAQLEMLRDVTNYGTNLIPRSFGSSDKKLRDVVVIGILLRQVVAMLDGVELLASNGAVHAASLQARSLFEASAYIDWILLADGEKKAIYYYVHNLRRQRRLAQRLQPGSPEATAFAASMPDLESLKDPKVIEQAQDDIKNIDRVLSQHEFAVVSKTFDQFAKRRKADPAWYVPLGMRSVNAVISAVGRSAEYTMFYNPWSETMHSSNYRQHVRMGKGTVTFEPLRHLEGFAALFRLSVTTALRTYRAILTQYRDGELRAFSTKYSENWKKALMEVPTIKYQVTTNIPVP